VLNHFIFLKFYPRIILACISARSSHCNIQSHSSQLLENTPVSLVWRHVFREEIAQWKFSNENSFMFYIYERIWLYSVLPVEWDGWSEIKSWSSYLWKAASYLFLRKWTTLLWKGP